MRKIALAGTKLHSLTTIQKLPIKHPAPPIMMWTFMGTLSPEDYGVVCLNLGGSILK